MAVAEAELIDVCMEIWEKIGGGSWIKAIKYAEIFHKFEKGIIF